jgi:hypothetical protein
MKTYEGMSEEEIGERWDASVALTISEGFVDLEDGQPGGYGVAIVRRATKHFLPGDVFPISWSNGGGERQQVWCRTRRGRILKHFYVEYANYESIGRYDFDGDREWHVRAKHHRKSKDGESLANNALVHLLEPPPGCIDGAWPSISSAAVRRYVVESTHAWHAGSRVGVGTPTFFKTEIEV